MFVDPRRYMTRVANSSKLSHSIIDLFRQVNVTIANANRNEVCFCTLKIQCQLSPRYRQHSKKFVLSWQIVDTKKLINIWRFDIEYKEGLAF